MTLAKTFEYQNPIYNDCFETIRDAQITVVDGIYFLIGSLPPFWEGASPGIKLFRSENLLEWECAAHLVDRNAISDDAWNKDRFWAPEIHYSGEAFYLTYTAKNEQQKTEWGTALAVCDTITGPYELLTRDKPLTGGIDLSLFTDDDGRSYAFWTQGGIRVAEVDLKNAEIISESHICAQKVPGTWEDRVIEGPYCIKRNGIYYVFYSCGARGYEVGYAWTEDIFGTWTKHDGPLFGVQNQESCDKMGIEFTGDPDCPLMFAGHNAVFPGPDGRDWTSYLIQEKGKPEQMGIDPIWIEDGVIKTNAPTYTKQVVEY
jgi:beta-xylosidase